MNLEAFLHNLHFDIDKAKPPDWEVDWDDAPLTYKLYRGLPVIPFSLEVPLTLEGDEATAKPDLRRIGHFLWYVFGLTQLSQSVMNLDSSDTRHGPNAVEPAVCSFRWGVISKRIVRLFEDREFACRCLPL